MKLSLLKASEEFGVTRETIRRGLAEIGIEHEKGRTYSIREVHEALAGDLKKARAREATANAIAKERDNAEADRILYPFDGVQSWMDKVLLSIRQRLLSMPAQMASRSNPSDPQFAQSALDGWVSETLPLLRSDLQSVK